MKTPLAFTLDKDAKCHNEKKGGDKHDFVFTANVADFPPTCVVCLARLMDEPMEWRLSNTIIQTLAHRAHSAQIRAEEDRLIAMLPANMRRRKRG